MTVPGEGAHVSPAKVGQGGREEARASDAAGEPEQTATELMGEGGRRGDAHRDLEEGVLREWQRRVQ